MLTDTVCLWWNEEEWKDPGMGSNMIMRGLTGVTFPITAALGLIKTQPPLSITIYMFMNCSLEGWLHHVLFCTLGGTQSKTLRHSFPGGVALTSKSVIPCCIQSGQWYLHRNKKQASVEVFHEFVDLICLIWLGVITSLAPPAFIQAVSDLAIKHLRWFQSQDSKQ